MKTKGITLREQKVDELIQKNQTEMEASFDDTVSHTISTLVGKIADIKAIHANIVNTNAGTKF